VHNGRIRGRGVMWPVRGECRWTAAWRSLPADFPPWQTVYGYFAA
jgi:transposase